MNKRKRTIGIALVLSLVLLVPPFWITFRKYRQARLDHALIEAIKAGGDKKALEVSAEGAKGIQVYSLPTSLVFGYSERTNKVV